MRKYLYQNAMMIGLAAAAWASPVMGQRGEVPTGHPSDFSNPTQGFPGFFDTNLAEKGSLVVEWPPVLLPLIPMPSIAVDYGVSDTLTVGTNALVSTIPWLVGSPGISLKARTLIYGTSTAQSTATFYGGYIGNKAFSTSWEVFTSNTSWKLAPRHIVTGQMMFMNFSLESGSESDIEYTNLRLSTLGLGAGYQFIVTDTAMISTYVLAPAWTSVEADSVAANLSANFDARSGDTTWGIARSSIDIHRDDWVYSIGGLYIQGLGSNILPWFSATTRW